LKKPTEKVLQKVLEAFVAMLRGRQKANADDVELYMRKVEHLQVAIGKLNASTITGDCLNAYLEVVNNYHSSFAQLYPQYLPYLVFTKMMCDLGHLSITQKKYEDSIDENLRKISDNSEVIV
jgi:CHAD domain-containing protein